MRIVELLAFLRDLLTSEFRALFVDALPAALHDLRDSLQATVDQCLAFFADDSPPFPRRRRRKRLSRMNATVTLLADDQAIATARGRVAHLASVTSRQASFDEAYDDDAASVSVPTGGNASIVEVDDAVSSIADDEETGDTNALPPLLVFSAWNDAIPRVPGIVQEKPLPPPDWTTDWKTNSYAVLRVDSETDSDVLSVASSADSCGLDNDPIQPFSVMEVDLTKRSVDEEADDEANKPDEIVVSDEEVDVAISSMPFSNESSCKPSVPGMSYRQLIEEVSPPSAQEEETDASVFYRAALQKLKQEREQRARLRAKHEDSPTKASLPRLAALRRLQVTPVTPEYKEDDETRHARLKKLDSLRQRTTPFAIKIGQPLNYTTMSEAPEQDGPYYV